MALIAKAQFWKPVLERRRVSTNHSTLGALGRKTNSIEVEGKEFGVEVNR